ncbi:MAG TPA: ABC transporter permease, partial [Bryobacteraceae bacterium]
MNWWQRLLKRARMEKQLDSELRFHFESQVAAKIRAGLTEEEARRKTRLEFGGLDQIKEECRDARGMRWVETTMQDVRFAWRGLWKSPAFAAVAVITLALGIGANTAVFTIVNGVLLRPLSFPEPDRLFLISVLPRDNRFAFQPGLPDRNYLEFLRQDQVFESIATFGVNPLTLTGAGEPLRVAAMSVTPGFAPTLRVNPALGRSFLPQEGEPGRDRVVLLSDKIWRSRFGSDPRITGKTIALDGVPHTVVGVMPLGFNFPNDAEMWTPLAVTIDPHNSYFRPVIGRLKAGISPRQAQVELDTFVRRLSLAAGKKSSDLDARIIPLKDSVVGKTRNSLLIFAGAVAFVLLIACANVANLLLIRATARRQEISVRAALGAGRWRLIRQLLTESLLVSLAGGVGGTLLAVAGVPALLALAPEGKIPRTGEIHIDAWVLLFTIAVSVLTGILFGLAPAFGATRSELRESLSGSGRTSTARQGGFRKALVVLEIALALVLLTGAGLMLKSF